MSLEWNTLADFCTIFITCLGRYTKLGDVELSSSPRALRIAGLLVAFFIIANLLMTVIIRILGSQMYPFFVAYYVWVPVYTCLIGALLYRERLKERSQLEGGYPILFVVVLTIAVRLIFIGQTEIISLDPLWYLDFGKFMQMGLMPYSEFYYPYPPVFAYFIFIIVWLAPSVDSFRVLAALMDAGVVITIWSLARRLVGPSWSGIAAMMYALFPISVIESGWNGHFEPIANLFMLTSLWCLLEGRHRVSGMLLGLGAATKFYPLALFPLFIFYLKEGKQRLEFLLVTVVSIAITFVPLSIAGLITGNGTIPDGSSSFGSPLRLFSSLFSFLSNPNETVVILNMLVIGGVVVGTVLTVRQFLRGNAESYWHEYQWTSLVLGITLIFAGVGAGVYPLTQASRLVYWRYPVDIGIVRGLSAVAIGLMVVREAYKSWKGPEPRAISLDSLLILVSATILLLLAMSRDVFYGWYILWSLPLFLLVRNKRLMLTVVLCLLLVYPSYTHDNFATLGFQEQRIWSDDFESVEGWVCLVNVSNSGLDPGQISAGVEGDGQSGRFWINTTSVDNVTLLRNVTASFTKAVSFVFEPTTEFATRITCSWDPTFGQVLDLSLTYEGTDSHGRPANGSIIPRSGLFTNLTHMLWRYAFWTESSDSGGGNVDNLTFTIYPAKIGEYWYIVDFLYTVYAGPLDPMYFLFTPILVAISLAAYIPLERESANWAAPAAKKTETGEDKT